MSAENCRNTGCSGCPHCSYEMRAILDDASAGRFEALSHKMSAIKNRTIRLLGVTPRHHAVRHMASGGSGTVEGPSHAGYIAKFKRGTTSAADRLREAFDNAFAGRSEISPAPTPNVRPGAHIPAGAPPDMNKMIRDRKEKK